MTIEVAIADLDCIYLSYDEPQKERFWLNIKNSIPWAVRVDGIKGSDAAHKAAAEASTTDRFILIDGDNLPNYDFFKETLYLNDANQNCVFRWRARNIINGLVYGNGGISSWTKDYVYNMRTHEASDGRLETLVEFCFDPLYWAMHNCYSDTYPNESSLQAFRSGFREGVKMCLDRGRKVAMNDFKKMLSHHNIEILNIWHSIGFDVKNGSWAVYGARVGTYMCMLDPVWNYVEVHNFDSVNAIFQKINSMNPQMQQEYYKKITDEIRSNLQLPCIDMTAEQSAFWKKYYTKLHSNRGIMDTAS